MAKKTTTAREIPADVKRALNDLRCASRKLVMWFRQNGESRSADNLQIGVTGATEAWKRLVAGSES